MVTIVYHHLKNSYILVTSCSGWETWYFKKKKTLPGIPIESECTNCMDNFKPIYHMITTKAASCSIQPFVIKFISL